MKRFAITILALLSVFACAFASAKVVDVIPFALTPLTTGTVVRFGSFPDQSVHAFVVSSSVFVAFGTAYDAETGRITAFSGSASHGFVHDLVPNTDGYVYAAIDGELTGSEEVSIYMWSGNSVSNAGVPVAYPAHGRGWFSACKETIKIVSTCMSATVTISNPSGNQIATLTPTSAAELTTSTWGYHSIEFTNTKFTNGASEATCTFSLLSVDRWQLEPNQAHRLAAPSVAGCEVFYWNVPSLGLAIGSADMTIAAAHGIDVSANERPILEVAYAVNRVFDVNLPVDGDNAGPDEVPADNYAFMRVDGTVPIHGGARLHGTPLTIHAPITTAESAHVTALIYTGTDRHMVQSTTAAETTFTWLPTQTKPLQLLIPMYKEPQATVVSDHALTNVNHYFVAREVTSYGFGTAVRAVAASAGDRVENELPLGFAEHSSYMAHNTTIDIVGMGHVVKSVCTVKAEHTSAQGDLYFLAVESENAVANASTIQLGVLAGASIHLTATHETVGDRDIEFAFSGATSGSIHWFSYDIADNHANGYHIRVRPQDPSIRLRTSIYASQGTPLPTSETALWQGVSSYSDDGIDLPILNGFSSGVMYFGIEFHDEVHDAARVNVAISAEGGKNQQMVENHAQTFTLSSADPAMTVYMESKPATDYIGGLIEVDSFFMADSLRCGLHGAGAVVGTAIYENESRSFRIEHDDTLGVAMFEVTDKNEAMVYLSFYADNWDFTKTGCEELPPLKVTLVGAHLLPTTGDAVHSADPSATGSLFLYAPPSYGHARSFQITTVAKTFAAGDSVHAEMLHKHTEIVLADLHIEDPAREETSTYLMSNTMHSADDEALIRIDAHEANPSFGSLHQIRATYTHHAEIFAGVPSTVHLTQNADFFSHTHVERYLMAVTPFRHNNAVATDALDLVFRARLVQGTLCDTCSISVCVSSGHVGTGPAQWLDEDCDYVHLDSAAGQDGHMNVHRARKSVKPIANDDKYENGEMPLVHVAIAVTGEPPAAGTAPASAYVEFDVIPVLVLKEVDLEDLEIALEDVSLGPTAFIAVEVPVRGGDYDDDDDEMTTMPWGPANVVDEVDEGVTVAIFPNIDSTHETVAKNTTDILMHTTFHSFYTIDYANFYEAFDGGRSAIASGFHALTMTDLDYSMLEDSDKKHTITFLFRQHRTDTYGDVPASFSLRTMANPMMSLDEDAYIHTHGAAGPFEYDDDKKEHMVYQKYASAQDSDEVPADFVVEMCQGSGSLEIDYRPDFTTGARPEKFNTHSWPRALTPDPFTGSIRVDVSQELQELVAEGYITKPDAGLSYVPFYAKFVPDHKHDKIIYEMVEATHHWDRPQPSIHGSAGQYTFQGMTSRDVVVHAPAAEFKGAANVQGSIMYAIFAHDQHATTVLTTPCGALLGRQVTDFVAEHDVLYTDEEGHTRVYLTIPAKNVRKLESTDNLVVVVQYANATSGSRMSGVFPVFTINFKTLQYPTSKAVAISLGVIFGIIVIVLLVVGGIFAHRWIIRTAPKPPKGYERLDEEIDGGFGDVLAEDADNL